MLFKTKKQLDLEYFIITLAGLHTHKLANKAKKMHNLHSKFDFYHKIVVRMWALIQLWSGSLATNRQSKRTLISWSFCVMNTYFGINQIRCWLIKRAHDPMFTMQIEWLWIFYLEHNLYSTTEAHTQKINKLYENGCDPSFIQQNFRSFFSSFNSYFRLVTMTFIYNFFFLSSNRNSLTEFRLYNTQYTHVCMNNMRLATWTMWEKTH